jgi:hypothetical protein
MAMPKMTDKQANFINEGLRRQGLGGGVPQNVQLQAASFKSQQDKIAEAGMPQVGNFIGAGGGVNTAAIARNTARGNLQKNFQVSDPMAKKAIYSPWMKQQLQQQDMMQTQQLNQGAQQAATAAASAQAGLARRGGLSSGAAERLAGAAQEQRALGAQNIYGQGAQQRLGMQVQDLQQNRDYLTGLQQQNVQTRLGELARKQDFDLAKYQEQMKGYGARKSAEATLNS